MKKITQLQAKSISGNVRGNGCTGLIGVVLHSAKKAGLNEVIISRPQFPPVPVVGDNKIFDNDLYVIVDLK